MKKIPYLLLVLAFMIIACATPPVSPTQTPVVEPTATLVVETPVTLESVGLEETLVSPASFPLSAEAVNMLRKVSVQTSEGYPEVSAFVFISEAGEFMGYADTLLIPRDGIYHSDSTALAGCTLKSLEYSNTLGYSDWTVVDAPPIVLDLNDLVTWKVLISMGLDYIPFQTSVLPDLCGRNWMEEFTGDLTWIATYQKNDMYSFSFSGFEVEVHTNSDQCDLYSWPDDEFFIVVVKFEGQPDREFLLEQGDLLKLEGGDIQGVRSVYITVVDGVPVYFWNRWTYSPQDASLIVSGYCLEGDCMPVASEISSPLPYLTDKWGLEEQSAPIPLIQ